MDTNDKLENISTTDFRDLEASPLGATAAGDSMTGAIEDDDDAGASPHAVDAADTDIDSELARVLGDDVDAEISNADMDDETITDEDTRANSAMSTPAFDVVLESDLDQPDTHIHSPDLDAPNVPGEIDIEDLDESDLEGAGLPPDALLDPLED
jgi:hypothetical protein